MQSLKSLKNNHFITLISYRISPVQCLSFVLLHIGLIQLPTEFSKKLIMLFSRLLGLCRSLTISYILSVAVSPFSV